MKISTASLVALAALTLGATPLEAQLANATLTLSPVHYNPLPTGSPPPLYKFNPGFVQGMGMRGGGALPGPGPAMGVYNGPMDTVPGTGGPTLPPLCNSPGLGGGGNQLGRQPASLLFQNPPHYECVQGSDLLAMGYDVTVGELLAIGSNPNGIDADGNISVCLKLPQGSEVEAVHVLQGNILTTAAGLTESVPFSLRVSGVEVFQGILTSQMNLFDLGCNNPKVCVEFNLTCALNAIAEASATIPPSQLANARLFHIAFQTCTPCID